MREYHFLYLIAILTLINVQNGLCDIDAHAEEEHVTSHVSDHTNETEHDDVTEFTEYDDVYSTADLRLITVFNDFYPDFSDSHVANYSSDLTHWGPIFLDNITATEWLNQCEAALDYYDYLCDLIVIENDNNSYVTYNRIDPLLGCLTDCDFSYLLSEPSEFNGYGNHERDGVYNDTEFANNVMIHLNYEAAQYCVYEFQSLYDEYFNPSFSSLMNDPTYINLCDPNTLDSFSEMESISLMESLSANNKELTDAQAEILAGNLPDNFSTPIDNLTALARALPLTSLDETSPETYIHLIKSGKLKLNSMDDSRKIYIAHLIIDSGNATLISELLDATSDEAILHAIPAYLLTELSISPIIYSTKLPMSYLQSMADKTLESGCISSITSLPIIHTLLPSITEEHLACIPHDHKITTIVEIVEAAINHNYKPSSVQRTHLLDSLLDSLADLASSKNASVYLKELSSTDCENLWPLFIEANSTVLSAFSHLSTFIPVVKKVAHLKHTDCCIYNPKGLELFTSYAVSKLFSYTKLSAADLEILGPCMYSHLPIKYIEKLNPNVFVSYYSKLGHVFQPNLAEQEVVTSLITSYALNKTFTTSQNKLFFTTLKDLALFYPFTNSTFANNLTSWKSSGGHLLDEMEVRDPENPDNHLCQLGLDEADKEELKKLLESYESIFTAKVLGSSEKRKRTTTSVVYNCTNLKQLGKGVTSLSIAQLEKISITEFINCASTFGAITTWSPSQLSTLANLALQYYKSASNLTTANICTLNSIMQGFNATFLSGLVFTSTTSINALGTLTKWSSNQLTALSTPLNNYISHHMNNNLTAKFISANGNLLCAFDSEHITTTMIKTDILKMSVGAPARINIACPNVATWYSIYRPLFKNNDTHHSKRSSATTETVTTIANTTTPTVVLSKSSVSELGTVIAGITISDLSTLPASTISSISPSAFSIMPAATVNSLTPAQLNGLSMSQLSALTNSQYYAAFSTTIKGGLTSLSENNKEVITTTSKAYTTIKNNGSKLNINFVFIILSCLLFFALF